MTLTVSLVSGRATMDQQQWEIQLRLTLSPGSSLQTLGDLEQKKNIRSSEKNGILTAQGTEYLLLPLL